MKEEFTDLVGKHLETFIAILVKALPGEIGQFGTGHKIHVDGDTYRYYFIMAKEGHPTYQELEKDYQQVRDE